MSAPLLFLSHSGHNTDRAVELRDRILTSKAARDGRLRVWLDKTDLQAGRPWKTQIENIIEEHATAFAVIVDPGGLQNWVAAETDVALSAAMKKRDFRFIPIFMGTRSQDLSPFARQYQGVRDPLNDPSQLQALLAAVLSQESDAARPVLTDQPFPGPVSMDESWSDRFFGREEEITRLVAQLSTNPFVAIVADSGTGKSSLAMAGVGAAWRGGRFEPESTEKPPPRNWNVITFRPRAHPLYQFTEAIRNDFSRRGVDHAAEAEILPSVLSGDPVRLLDTLSRGMPPGDTRTLLIVDQGEELFTQTTDEGRRSEFCRLLAGLVREGATNSRLRILMPIRSDFANQLTSVPELALLAKQLEEGQNRFRLKGMSPEGICAMVQKPLHMAGFKDDAQAAVLAERIISDLPQHEGDVALAQFALSETWRDRGPNNELLAAYARVNGVLGALGQKAERLLASAELTNAERARVIPIFLRLVSLDAGALRVSRRTAQRHEFSEADWALISRFASEDGGRLLQTSDSTVEISHERLITQWKRLHESIAENGLHVRVLGRLTNQAAAWKDGRKARAFLTSQSDEEAFQYLAKAQPNWLSTTEREYLEWTRKQHRNRRWGLRALATVIAGLIVLVGVFIQRADRQFARAEESNATALSTLALAKAESAPVDAIKLALAAWPETKEDVAPVGSTALIAFGKAVALQRTRTLAHYDGSVFSVALSADGTRIASGGNDRVVQLWNAATGEELWPPITGHIGPVNSVALSVDGTQIASGGEDGTIQLWDAATGEKLRPPMGGNNGSVFSVALSANKMRIASGGYDGTIRLWNADSGQELLPKIMKHGGRVLSVALNADGTRIASGGTDGTVRLWDAVTGDELLPGRMGHGNRVRSVALSRDGTRIASAGEDGAVRLWNAATGEELLPPLMGHDGSVRSVALSADGKQIASGGTDGTVRLWDAATGRTLLLVMMGHDGSVESVALSQDGTQIASGGMDGTIRLWDTVAGTELLHGEMGHKGWVRSVALSRDGTRIASGGEDGTVRLWDAATGEELLPGKMGHGSRVNSIALSADGARIASGGEDGAVRLWDAATGDELLPREMGHSSRVNSVAVSADGTRIASGGNDRKVRLWDTNPGQTLRAQVIKHDERVLSVALNADGTKIASGDDNGTVRLLDATTGEDLLERLNGHEGSVNSVALSEDGTQIASGGTDRTVRRWDAVTGGELLPPITGHERSVLSVALSKEGARIASSGEDGTVRLWDAATGGELLSPLEMRDTWVHSVALNANGTRIASGGNDGTVRLWDATRPKGNLFQVACRLLPMVDGVRDLSSEGLAAEIGISDLRLPADCEIYDPPLPQDLPK